MREIESLTKRAQKYLESAALLFGSGDFESSTSRSYYSMFYMVEALFLKKGLSYSSHKAVISAFGEQFIKPGIFPKELGRELNRAFEKRQLGDYEFDFVISSEEAQYGLNQDQKFFKVINDFIMAQK